MAQDSSRRTPFRVGDWRVEPDTGLLIRGEEQVRLEPRVMDLLVCLASAPGEVMSRDELESRVWAGMIVGYDSLASAVIKLRKAFGDNSRDPHVIQTVSKRGYRLIAEVTLLEPEPVPETASTNTAPSATAPFGRRHLAVAAGALVGIIILLGLLVWLPGSEQAVKTPPSTTAAEQASLVVLPFTSSSGDDIQEYFSDGITDDLISDLSRYSGLEVVARRSAYIYKQRHTDIQTIARELGVRYVLDGDVRRDGDHVRLNVQLIDAGSGMNIWAQRFDRQVEDIFAVQDDIRSSILNALSVTLTAEERGLTRHGQPVSFAAYDLFLQGQASLVARASATDSQRAQGLMEQALKEDPNFARAWAALALIHAEAYRFDWTEDPEHTRQQALDTGRRALELDPRSPQAWWIMGYVHLFLFEDHEQAIAAATKARKLAPNDLDAANVLAVTYAFGDKPELARVIVSEIIARNKYYSSLVPSVLGLANLRLGNYSEALAAYDKSLLINPSRIQGNAYRAITLYRMGNTEEAEFQVDQLYTLHPNFDLELWMQRQPFKDKAISAALAEDLRKATAP